MVGTVGSGSYEDAKRQVEEIHRANAEQQRIQQAHDLARMIGVSDEEALVIIATGKGTGEQAEVHPLHAASVSRRADDIPR